MSNRRNFEGRGSGRQEGTRRASPEKEKKEINWRQLKQDVRSALKGIGMFAGSTMLGAGIAWSTGEKGKHEIIVPQESVSSGKSALVTKPPVPELPFHTKEEAEDYFPAQSSPAFEDAVIVKGGEIITKEAKQEEKFQEKEPVVIDETSYRELASMQPSTVLAKLDKWKELSNAKDILHTILDAGFPEIEESVLEFLPKIWETHILSDEEFSGFVTELVKKNPAAYVRRLKDGYIAKYLPQGPETVVWAIEQDPEALYLLTLSARSGLSGGVPEVVTRAITSSGDSFLQKLYEVLVNPEKKVEVYNQSQKMKMAALLPLVREGKMTFDGVADLDPLEYFELLAEMTKAPNAEPSVVVAREFRQTASHIRAALWPGDAEGKTFQEVADYLPARAIHALIVSIEEDSRMYGQETRKDDPMHDLIRRFSDVLEEKMKEEGLSWEKLLETSRVEDTLGSMAASAETGNLLVILGRIPSRTQEKIVRAFFDEFQRHPTRAAPELAVVIAALEDSTLMGLVKNEIEDLYKGARTPELQSITAIFARIAQEVNPEPPDSLFAKIAARGAMVSV